MILFLKSLLFGFLLAATVGPMWVLCLRRTLAQGALAGLASGMGIALADGFYGAVAAFGLTAVSGVLLKYSFWIGLVGGIFLLYLGIKCLTAKPAPIQENSQEKTNLPQAFLSTLGLTLANPPTILAFVAIFAGLGLVASDYGVAALMVLGVFLGSASWWAILAAGAGWLRGRIGPRLIRAINVFSGLTILGFAAWRLTAVLE
ncbi:MAG TPA: LysE family transporter [Burkholderiales bacterium]|nr:LysE family transporter [Burkholderiales bacterium]